MSTGEPPAGGTEKITATPPSSSEAIQPGEPGRVLLPPITPPPPEPVSPAFLGRLRTLDGLLLVTLLAFAFLCGSFKAANSDIFMHLASGRHLVQGGANPFGGAITSYATSERWVNHSWLFDLTAYLVYNLASWGEIALVVLKAILCAAVAWAMARAASRPGESPWVPLVFAALGMLAMSGRLLLQPAVASFFLLAVTLSILARANRESRSVWLLPAICLVWVNLDSWFILGPVTILLYLLGGLAQIQMRRGAAGDDVPPPRTLGLVFAASLAACLVNPSHVFAFTSLPTGLLRTGGMSVFMNDPAYASFFISPFESRYFSPYFGLSASGVAFFVLAGLGLISFSLLMARKPDALRAWRALVWVAFLGLSAWSYRTIPFFAIVAAPITALNFLDLVAGHAAAANIFKVSERRWAVQGRVFTVMLGVALVLLCVPGWLQILPHYRRQVGWGFEVDAGLRDACIAARSWRDAEPKLVGRRWHNTSPDGAYYLAWFYPGEQTYIDARLGLFHGAAEEYDRVRRSLTGEDIVEEGRAAPRGPAWREAFAERQVSFVLVQSQELARSNTALATLARMYSNPIEFVPCFSQGSTAIFAWRGPGAIDTTPPPAENFNARSFGAKAEQAPLTPAPPAPPPEWWRALLVKGEQATPMDSLTAVQQKMRFDSLSMRYEAENNQGFISGQITSFVGLVAAQNGPFAAGAQLPARRLITWLNMGEKTPLDNAARELQGNYLRAQDVGPPASAYLAVRAARRGLLTNPDDVTAKIYLAESYSRLAYRTREFHSASERRIVVADRREPLVPHVLLVRQAQIATALQSILTGNARPEQQRAAHELLLGVYTEPLYFDLQVKHFREYLKLAKKVGPTNAPADPRQLGEYFKSLEDNLKAMTTRLNQMRDQFEVKSANKPLLERAQIAMMCGLSETAVNLLLAADPKDLVDRNNPSEVPGATMVVSLLLAMGRTAEVRDALTGDGSRKGGFGMHPLGMPAFEWFEAQLGAAVGDYDMADKALADCIEKTRDNHPFAARLSRLGVAPLEFAQKRLDISEFTAFLVGTVILREGRYASGLPLAPLRRLSLLNLEYDVSDITNAGVQVIWDIRQQEATLWTLRGWLALEAGKIEDARAHCKKAISLAETEPGSNVVVVFRSRPMTELVLQMAENRLRRD